MNEYEIDWRNFLAQSDIDWPNLQYSGIHYYNNPKLSTKDWGDSAYIGNGMVGAAIYKENQQVLRWELGRNDVEAHCFIEGVDWCIPRVPIGDVFLSPIGNITQENMHLSLWDAEATGHIYTDAGEIYWRSFAHAVKNIILIELTTKQLENGCTLNFKAKHGISPRLQFVDPSKISGNCILPPEPYYDCIDGICISVQSFVRDDGTAEGECCIAWKEIDIGGNKRVFLISIENSQYDNTARITAIDNIKSTYDKAIEELENSHRNWWHLYYPQSFLSVSDKYWEKFYWIQMYKLASATRGEMDEVIDNQGPWLTKTKWPGSWWNLNVQLSYSPLYKANRLNIAESLIRSLETNIEALKKNAEPLGIQDGIYMARTSGRNLQSPSPSYEDIVNSEEGLLSFELGNFTWALHNIWRHYRSIMDTTFLKERIYPLLKMNMNAFLRLLDKGDDGKWHLPKLTSPEYPGPNGGTSYPINDTNYDLALLRWGCKALLETNAELDLKDPLAEKWQEVLENLVEYQQDENGLMVGRGVSFSQSHRHYSHLVALYPLHLLDLCNPAERKLAEKSFMHWISMEDMLVGYSYTGGACMAAALGNGNLALEVLNKLKDHLLPNTLYMESGGPVIETPLSGAESIHYMVLQSWGDTLRTFPAVPDLWEDLAFAKLLAEGGFEVSGRRSQGKNEFVYIKSLAGAPLKIMPNLSGKIKTFGNRSYKIKEILNGIYEIDLKKGETILMYVGEGLPDISIIPVKEKSS